MNKKRIIIAGVFLYIAGCSGSLPLPEDGDSGSRTFQGESVSTDELRADREMYIRKCSGCHGLYLPAEFPDDQWKEILPAMYVKARTTELEARQIERFLLSYSFKNTTQ